MKPALRTSGDSVMIEPNYIDAGVARNLIKRAGRTPIPTP
jgi:hypothetical protein